MVDLAGRVAIVTGAGGGLGRAHALALARRGARLVVNDLGGARDGSGRSTAAADAVVADIAAAGGDALADGADVTRESEVARMVGRAMERWGRIDILVNNAGVLRDRSFAKMTLDDFRFVLDVHLMGSVTCTKAVWSIMRDQAYGRIMLTTSSSGLYGNFGQANYGAAKMAMVGFMNSLHLEGAKYDIRVNCLSPSAATRMTEDVMPAGMLDALGPDLVSQGMLALVADAAPSRMILCAGAGVFEAAHVTLTQGIYAGDAIDPASDVLARLEDIADRTNEEVLSSGPLQAQLEIEKARRAVDPPLAAFRIPR